MTTRSHLTGGIRLGAKLAAITTALLLLTLTLTPASSSATGSKDRTEYVVDEESLPFEPLEGTEATQLWGVKFGAGYRIEVPDNWNGDLIMWTHGFRGEGERLFFNEREFPDGFRRWMLDQGYAWAASTYGKNDYNVSQGVIDTFILSRYFNYKVDRADDVYIAGYSMGGHIAAVSAELFGRTYSGAMPLCGVVGDYELFDYFLDVNVAGQQLALGQSQFPVGDNYIAETVPAMKEALGTTPDPASWFLFQGLPLTESGQQFKQLVELRSGGDRPNFDEGFTYWFSIPSGEEQVLGNFLWDLGPGDGTVADRRGVVVDNTDAVYQVDLDPAISEFEAALNDDVARVSQDRRARVRWGLANPPPVTGRLKMPVLTMHNLGDLFVPYHNEIEYAKDVARQGKDHLLVQRAIRGVDHCGFTSGELIEGMSDLIAWAEGGPRPDGDIVLDPTAVAAEDYGCAYTRFDEPAAHTLATPCP